MPETPLRSPERTPEPPPLSDRKEQTPFRVEQTPQEEAPQTAADAVPATPNTAPAAAVHVRTIDPMTRDVETVLQEGLGELYLSLDEATRQTFREQGEEAASAIATLLRQTKMQVRKIVQLIVAWLRVIPGVSRIFAEQEAKIKTDRLLGLRQDRKDGGQ